MPNLTIDSPLGPLCLTEEAGAITRLTWGLGNHDETPVLLEAKRQLAAYFNSELKRFDLPLAPDVSQPHARVLDAMRQIPFGETKTYGDLSKATGLPAQAVGQACGANPIAILIPCHRVTGTGPGKLGGFSAPGGVETKIALLKHENAYSLLI